MGSSEPDAQKIFSEQKDIVNNIIKEHEPRDVKYGLIQYETEARRLAGFNDFKDISIFKKFVEILTWKGDAVGLDDALEKANTLFREEGRPFSGQVLVVFTDGRVDGSSDELEEAVKPLKERNVKIIPVLLQQPADEASIQVLLPKGKEPIRKSTERPEDTDDTIKQEIHKGLRLRLYNESLHLIQYHILINVKRSSHSIFFSYPTAPILIILRWYNLSLLTIFNCFIISRSMLH